MKKPNFRTRKSDGLAQVYYDIYMGKSGRLVGKTDVIIDTRYWNSPADVKADPSLPHGIDLAKAQKLGKKKDAKDSDTALDDFVTWYQKGDPKKSNDPEYIIPIDIQGRDELAYEIDVYFKRIVNDEADGPTPLSQYFKEHIVFLEEEKNVRYSTVYYYERLEKLMREFCKENKKQFKYETFANKNTMMFKQYLSRKRKYGQNTWNLYLTMLKSVMGRSYDLEYHDVRQYKVAKTKRVNHFDIYLTEDEVCAIRDLKLDNKKDRAARDWFILMCRTGERVTDVIGGTRIIGKDDNGKIVREILKPWDHSRIEEIDGVLQLKLSAHKTGKNRYFPVSDELKTILERYALVGQKYCFPSDNGIHITAYFLTNRIRKMADMVGINNDVKGKPKNLWIKPHTSRRTAVTLAYLSGMEIDEIRRKITLHKDDATTINYIMADNSAIEREMRKRGDVA